MEKLRVINEGYLGDNDVKPNILKDQEYENLQEITCECGQKHVDIGLKSHYNYITCYKCKEELPEGNKIHWCNKERFLII